MNTMLTELRRNRAGFTLIEVVVSIFILSVVAIMYTTTIPTARKAAYMNGQYAQATSLCQHKIDQLRAIGPGRMDTFQELSDAGVVDTTPTGSPYSFTVKDNLDNHLNDPTEDVRLPQATGKMAITKNVLLTDAMDVTVTITWKPTLHQAHTCTMSLSATITNQGT